MAMTMKITAGLLAALTLSACEGTEGTRRYYGPDSVVATAVDRGRDTGVLRNGVAAIVYDPDGCQNWMIDDGLEGYSSPRFDPVSGLPICNDLYPPGTILGDYETTKAGIKDRVAGPGRNTVVVKR